MTKGPFIAGSFTAEVFAWDENQVLKLFRNTEHARWVLGSSPAEEESRNTRAARETGLDVPKVNGMVEVDGRQGIVFERIEGPSIRDRIRARPWTLLNLARRLADVHSAVHTHVVSGLPSQRLLLERRIQAAALPVGAKEVALSALGELPDDNVLCHGDFQPKNVLMSSHGPVLIDWMRATQGNPLADVAHTLVSLLLSPARPVKFGRWPDEAARALLRKVYLRRYLHLRPDRSEQIAAWQLPIAAARVGRGIAWYERRLLALVEHSLLPKAKLLLANSKAP